MPMPICAEMALLRWYDQNCFIIKLSNIILNDFLRFANLDASITADFIISETVTTIVTLQNTLFSETDNFTSFETITANIIAAIIAPAKAARIVLPML